MKNVLVTARLLPIAAMVALAFPLVACGEKKQAQAPAKPAPTAPDATTRVTSSPTSNAQMAVNVDDEIMKACNIKFTNTEAAPKFDFDSDALTQAERDILEAVAKCLTSGPLKGRSVELVGRTDPRGEQEYNMTLGARRARAVQGYMTQLGVSAGNMRETSRGELDATGKDEAGYRLDRRVDVKLIAR